MGNESRSERKAQAVDSWTVAYKEVFPLRGVTSTAGTRFLQRTGTEDHELVARLRAAGAVCVGATSMSELGFSLLGENEAAPAPTNPFDEERVCGGSSSGSAAAVAAGVVDVGIGTDSGGSVRLPAAWCGLVGFKPTTGLTPLGSALTFSPTIETIGVISRSVAATRTAAEAMWRDLPEPVSPDVRIVVDKPPPVVDRAVMKVYSNALHLLSKHLRVEQASPGTTPIDDVHAFRRRYGSTAADEGWERWRKEVRAAGDLASPRLRQWFATHCASSPQECELRERARSVLGERFARHVRPGGVLACVTSPLEPPTFEHLSSGDYDATYRAAQQTLWPVNELDAPAITIPCGHTPSGLPVGLQLYAPAGRDLDVLRVAEIAEHALATDHTRPPTRENIA